MSSLCHLGSSTFEVTVQVGSLALGPAVKQYIKAEEAAHLRMASKRKAEEELRVSTLPPGACLHSP